MALKPTIYKMKIALSDLNRNRYDTLHLTVAQHPSETIARMMVRVLAFCINAEEFLTFTKGISAAEEPDIWAHALDGKISLWIDVGEPAVDRIKKAARLAPIVKVYSFNAKSHVWWEQVRAKSSGLKASIFQFEWESIQSLAELVRRTMDFSVTVSGDSAYVATEAGQTEVSWIPLQVA